MILVALREYQFWKVRFYFDDSFMYVRYVHNFQAGWGLAWDPKGPHVFGLTSLPWFYLVLLGSYLVHDPLTLLTMLSCVTGLVGMYAMSWMIADDARTTWMKRGSVLLPWIALPLLLNDRFGETWCNGMETMLGMLTLTLFLVAHRRFTRNANALSTALLACSAVACVATRPELLIVVSTLR